MSFVLEDGREFTKQLTNPVQQDSVIQLILSDEELVQYIKRMTPDPDTYDTVFHDTILNMVNIMMTGKAEIANPRLYMKAVARNVYLALVQKVKRHQQVLKQYQDLGQGNEIETVSPEDIFLYQERKQLLDLILEGTTDDCKEVLLKWAHNYRMKEIAEDMTYASKDYDKRKKYLCLQNVIKAIKSNPKLKKLLSRYYEQL